MSSFELAGEGRGPEALPAAPGDGTVDLARILLQVATIPANVEVIDAALRLVVALARVTGGGADGVSVCLRRQGALITVAASDATVNGMDSDQYATGEGPCVAAAHKGTGSMSSPSTPKPAGRRSFPGPGNAASAASSRPRCSPRPALSAP